MKDKKWSTGSKPAGWGGRVGDRPSLSLVSSQTPFSSRDTTLDAFEETNIGNRTTHSPWVAGAWSMAVVTAAAKKERESAQVVYMYVEVWE
jgi:hypothetical protein